MHLRRRLAALERRLIIEPTLLIMADDKIVRITANSDALLQLLVAAAGAANISSEQAVQLDLIRRSTSAIQPDGGRLVELIRCCLLGPHARRGNPGDPRRRQRSGGGHVDSILRKCPISRTGLSARFRQLYADLVKTGRHPSTFIDCGIPARKCASWMERQIDLFRSRPHKEDVPACAGPQEEYTVQSLSSGTALVRDFLHRQFGNFLHDIGCTNGLGEYARRFVRALGLPQ